MSSESKVERKVELFLRGGHRCEHLMERTDNEWEKLFSDMTMLTNGVLQTSNPWGSHRVADIVSFHVEDYEPPVGSRDVGFLAAIDDDDD